MSAALVVAFSDLLNKPKDTLASMARSGAVLLRLRRRDAEDLVLTTASRREQEHVVVSAASRLTAVLLGQADQQGRDRLLEALSEVFPTRFLSVDDRRLSGSRHVRQLSPSESHGLIAICLGRRVVAHRVSRP